MNIPKKMKEYRVVSIATLVFLCYTLHEFMQWIMQSNAESIGEGIAITGIMASIAAMFKFVFQFATARTKKDLELSDKEEI